MATRRPSIPVVQTPARDMQMFTEAVRETIERMLGVRGDPLERVVTLADLQAMGLDVSGALMARGVLPGKSVQQGADKGLTSYLSDAEAFASKIMATRGFRDLVSGMDDPDRFAWVPDQLRKELASSIAGEAAKRGADIRNIDQIMQSATQSFASRLEEITAGMAGAAAGVRSLSFAYADADRAIAADVTQVQAQLNGVDVSADTLGVGGTTGGAAYATLAALQAAVPTGVTAPVRKYYKVVNPVSGQPPLIYTWDATITPPQYKLAGKGTTTSDFFAGVEQTLKATADRGTGAEAQYTVKVTAGGAMAGFGLGAYDNGDGSASSAFLIQADKFAIVDSSYAGGLDNTPDLANVPFGVDGSGVYINGTVRINTGGIALEDIDRPATFIGSFASAPSTTGLLKNSFYANTTNGNSYVLDADGGTWVLFAAAGTSGIRGSVTLYTTGISWLDATANAAVLAFTGSSTKVSGDTVTISNSQAVSFVASSGYLSAVTADSPVRYYEMDEVSGTTAVDSIGAGNGTYSGTYTLNSSALGSTGKSVAVTGAGKLDCNFSTNYTSALTLELWFAPTAATLGVSTTLVGKREYFASAHDKFPVLLTWTSSSTVALVLSQGNDYTSDATLQSSALTLGDVYHVVAVYRASGLCELYVNSVLHDSDTIGFTINTNTLNWTAAMSAEYGGGVGGSGFTGSMAGLAIYSTALSAARVSAHYLAGSPGGGGPDFAGTKYWDGVSAWADPGVVIDGNLLVNGTVTADKIGVSTLSAISADIGTVTAGSVDTSGSVSAAGTGPGAGYWGASLCGNTDGSALYGVVGQSYSAGLGFGVIGIAATATGTGVLAQAANAGGNDVALDVKGRFYWGNSAGTLSYLFSPPTGSTTSFMRNDGTWAAPSMLTTGANSYTLTGGAVSGSTTVTMTLTNKPGAGTATNGWLKILIDATYYWIPIWPDV